MKPDPTLVDRIAAARILREHHVWAAAESFAAVQDRMSPTCRRFRLLMEADALLDAVTLLAESAEPPRTIQTLTRHNGLWHCAMRAGLSRRQRTADHADVAAAVLMTLLRTLPRPPRRGPARGHASVFQPNRSSQHDH